MQHVSRPGPGPGRDVVSGARPWLAAWAGGVCGTAVMTVALQIESKLRTNAHGPIDYDASDHVAIAACNALRRPVPESEAARNRISSAVHWGYGSAVAVTFEALRRATGSNTRAAVLFDAGCQAMAFTLFPTLGETPPPWEWDHEVVLSSLAVHAIYAATVAQVARLIRGR